MSSVRHFLHLSRSFVLEASRTVINFAVWTARQNFRPIIARHASRDCEEVAIDTGVREEISAVTAWFSYGEHPIFSAVRWMDMMEMASKDRVAGFGLREERASSKIART